MYYMIHMFNFQNYSEKIINETQPVQMIAGICNQGEYNFIFFKLTWFPYIFFII